MRYYVRMPVRKFRASPVKVTGTAPDGQRFESKLEEDFFCLLRFNPYVVSFEDQPTKIDWLDADGTLRKYTPDVFVRYRQDVPEELRQPPGLFEIKPEPPADEQTQSTDTDAKPRPRKRHPPRKENDEENKRKWKAAEIVATRNGWTFSVVFEKDIRTPYLENAKFLLRYLERMRDSPYQPRLLAILAERGELTLSNWVGALSHSLESRAEILPACYRLIARREVDVDLSVRLSMQSLVRPRSND